MRLIDADALRAAMYHEAFETDTDMQKWDSGCWIRYKMFENAIEAAPTVRVGGNACKHRAPDGRCQLYTDDEVTSYCVDGPCPDEEPTIEAEPVKHGRWENDFCSFVCSVCGGRISDSALDDYSEPRYCPHCGAKMDAKEGEA